ncbi:MAG TPA: hypothetical protein VFA59_23770 [Vicinamibacterales bacterium]|nr:hypothetical protein [Vicinamibacterales bacterium]
MFGRKERCDEREQRNDDAPEREQRDIAGEDRDRCRGDRRRRSFERRPARAPHAAHGRTDRERRQSDPKNDSRIECERRHRMPPFGIGELLQTAPRHHEHASTVGRHLCLAHERLRHERPRLRVDQEQHAEADGQRDVAAGSSSLNGFGSSHRWADRSRRDQPSQRRQPFAVHRHGDRKGDRRASPIDRGRAGARSGDHRNRRLSRKRREFEYAVVDVSSQRDADRDRRDKNCEEGHRPHHSLTRGARHDALQHDDEEREQNHRRRSARSQRAAQLADELRRAAAWYEARDGAKQQARRRRGRAGPIACDPLFGHPDDDRQPDEQRHGNDGPAREPRPR